MNSYDLLHAERAVLGSLLLDNSTLDDIGDYLQPDDFESSLYGQFYRVIRDILLEGKRADVICVSNEMVKGDGNGQDFFIQLSDITNSSFTPSNIKFYADIVKQNSIDRKMIAAAQNVITSVRNKKENRLDYAQQLFQQIAQNEASETILAVDILPEVLSSLDERHSRQDQVIGLPTGFQKLDKIIHGVHGGQLVVIAGRPAMGKTLLAMNIIENVTLIEKKAAIIFSMEMRDKELLERLLASTAKVNADQMRSGKLNKQDFEKIASIVLPIKEAKIFIDDRACLSISDIRAKCRRIKRKSELSLIVVDYISLMSAHGENETVRIANISRGLKLLARDLDVPVIAISQLNRGVEGRAHNDRRPTMADLRASGAVEQDSDLILLIYRDEVYHPQTPNKGIAEIIIAKNRNGNIGTINLIFNKNHCRFDNYVDHLITNQSPTDKRWTGHALDY